MIPVHFIEQIREPLVGDSLYLNPDARLVFICGGTAGVRTTARQYVLQYAERHFPGFLFFQAEDVFGLLNPAKDQDLLTLEINLLEYADCVLIILESPGAIAELGAFSASDEVAKRILVINDVKFANTDSFIRRGPVAKVDSLSRFRPSIYTDLDNVIFSGDQIKKRLDRIPAMRRKKIEYSNLVEVTSTNPKFRLLALLDLLAVFSPVTPGELRTLWNETIGASDKFEHDLAVVSALKLARKEGDYFLRVPRGPRFMYSFITSKLDSIRSAVLLHYFRKDKRRADLMQKTMLKFV